MRRTNTGQVELAGDWRPFRNAIEKAMQEEGIEKDTVPDEQGIITAIPTQVWNIGCLSILSYLEATQRVCGDCGKALTGSDDIRCLDCRWLMCPGCAEKHFWPNGRVSKEHV